MLFVRVHSGVLPSYLVCEGHEEVPRFLAVVVVADQLSLKAEHVQDPLVVLRSQSKQHGKFISPVLHPASRDPFQKLTQSKLSPVNPSRRSRTLS